MAILIDELMKDRDLVGNYILFLQAEIDTKVWTKEDSAMMHEYMFGEEHEEQVKDSVGDIKYFTSFFKEKKEDGEMFMESKKGGVASGNFN